MIPEDNIDLFKVLAQPIEILAVQELPVSQIGDVACQNEYVCGGYWPMPEESAPVGLELYM